MTKGIILAGGTGSRLAPLTKQDNKHLLPVYNKRMIEYPLKTLTDLDIKDIVIVVGGNRPGTFIEYLKDGEHFGVRSLAFTYQKGNGGVADALKCAKPFVKDSDDIVVILGDNYFEDGVVCQYNLWTKSSCLNLIWTKRFLDKGAGCLLQKTDIPWDFGIAEVSGNRIVSIEEKPKNPKSSLAILGCYFFDSNVWSIIDTIEPSDRGELEITDVLKSYMALNKLKHFGYNGLWSDMGTFESWTKISQHIEGLQNV